MLYYEGLFKTFDTVVYNYSNSFNEIAFSNISIASFNNDVCPNRYGNIAIVTLTTSGVYIEKVVFNAMQSVRCYAKMRGYVLYQMRLDGENIIGLDDDIIKEKCRNYSLLWKRHCIIANMLPNFNYIIHLDADSGVINPYHCFEEYITPGIDIFHLERAHSGEMQAGHYIVKNSNFSRQYLRQWYEYNKTFGTDNVVLHSVFSSHVLNKTAHIHCSDKRDKVPYFSWIRCIKDHMAGKRVYKNIKVYRRAHAFVRDAWTTDYKWSKYDFLLHAMKHQDDILFSRKLDRNDCSDVSKTWNIPVNTKYFVKDTKVMANIWRNADDVSFKKNLALRKRDISDCWPSCPDNV